MMAGKFSNWVEPGERLAEMRQNLLNATKYLETDKQYRKARPELVVRLLSQAEIYIKHAAGMCERNPELSGDSFIAFDACLLVAFRNMQLALRDPAVVIGTGEWESQVEKGKKGAVVRWGNSDSGAPHGEVMNEIVRRLLRNRPEEPYADLYDEFCSDCKADGLKPPGQKRFENLASIVKKTLSP
jgi:hypothetical protein